MSSSLNTPEDPQAPFAPRTPHIIGRQSYIDAIRNAITDQTGRSHALYFVGPGGIGKTRLLEEVAVILQAWTGKSFRRTEIIDLYYAKYHSPGGLREAIANGLDPDNDYFQKYRALRADFERKRQEGIIGRELEELRRQFDGVFQQEYSVLAREQRLVLCFDTLELIQYESDVVQEICRVQDVDTVIKNWLLEQVSRFPNSVTLFAGRPRPRVQADFEQGFDRAGCIFTLFELKAFSQEETENYLDVMGKVEPELSRILKPDIQKQVFHITQGRPIYLSLLIDLLLHGEVLSQIIPISIPATEFVDEQLVSQQLVEHLLNLSDPVGQIIYFLLHARKGMDADLLQYLMGDLWPRDQVQKNLELMRQFAFVKARSDTKQIFLHDEVYDLFDRYFVDDPRFGRQYESIAQHYRQRLGTAASLEGNEELMVAALYYELS